MPVSTAVFLWILLICLLCALPSAAQQPGQKSFETLNLEEVLRGVRLYDTSSVPSFGLNASSIFQLPDTEKDWTKPALFLRGSGYTGYDYQYLSKVDTPYAESSIGQHLMTAGWRALLPGRIPVRIRVNARVSNSAYFRNFVDVQLGLDRAGIAGLRETKFRQRLARVIQQQQDSLESIVKQQTALSGGITKLNALREQIRGKLLDATELINIPALSFDSKLPDSLNLSRADSIQGRARQYIEWAGRFQQSIDSVSRLLDKLGTESDALKQRISRLNNVQSMEELRRTVGQAALDSIQGKSVIPGLPSWVQGIQQLDIGRAAVNYSEFTARHLTLNGFNAEYNRRLYVAVAVGFLEFRYRDFLFLGNRRPMQPFFLGRIGINRPGRAFIFSLYHGKRKVFASLNSPVSIPLTGVSVESKWNFGPANQLTVELAQSSTRFTDTLSIGGEVKNKADFRNNKALFIGLNGRIRKLNATYDLKYRFVGEQFQSFSRFQLFTRQEQWSIRWTQQLLKNHVRMAAAIHTNDFSNPQLYTVYNSLSVNKTFQVSFVARKWPMVTLGYLPSNQVVRVGENWVVNQFQLWNGSIVHQYSAGALPMATNVTFNKFAAGDTDTSYRNFGASNFSISHSFFFKGVTAQLQFADNGDQEFRYIVLEENLSWPVTDRILIESGVKLNQVAGSTRKTGFHAGGSLSFAGDDHLYFGWTRDYFPGNNKLLFPRSSGTIQYNKSF
ncbi:MAG: hypothetical protein ABWZ25_08765 [Chitinophagaceae bacterium]